MFDLDTIFFQTFCEIGSKIGFKVVRILFTKVYCVFKFSCALSSLFSPKDLWRSREKKFSRIKCRWPFFLITIFKIRVITELLENVKCQKVTCVNKKIRYGAQNINAGFDFNQCAESLLQQLYFPRYRNLKILKMALKIIIKFSNFMRLATTWYHCFSSKFNFNYDSVYFPWDIKRFSVVVVGTYPSTQLTNRLHLAKKSDLIDRNEVWWEKVVLNDSIGGKN